MDLLGRYYTQDTFSELLVQNLDFETPNTVLDLGAGAGSLIKAAYNRWNNAEFIAADIDLSSVKKLNTNLPFIKVFHADGLKLNIEKYIELGKSSIDVAICNPPYLQVSDKKRFEKLLIDANLPECLNLNKLTSDIIFLAQNLKFLKPGGELGIILPDSIVTGQEFRILRNSLLTNHSVKALIELPDRIFSKTEAKTHIILIKKQSLSKSKIPLLIAGKDGQCYDQIDINSSSLDYRMDFSYHKVNTKLAKKSVKRLRDFEFELKRGNRTNAELKASKLKFLHSTSFKDGSELYLVNPNKKDKSNIVLAEKGSLLITRVGRGCVGKAAIIKKGKLPISDCLYVIKAEQKLVAAIWNFINSNEGKIWIKAISHGVCAKVLSREDILNLPIFI